jgi:protein-S-isoprenylcysteine O-methyltransferase Ste14
MGLLLMLSGLALRAWAAKTLGEFYTRTLQIVEGQPLIDKAPYRVIRHPGYLGIFLMGIGAGLAILNWVALLGGVVVGACSRVYRICSEAVMLKTTFGEQHEAYSAKNWRLLPFIY